jgi:hypothetical protein
MNLIGTKATPAEGFPWEKPEKLAPHEPTGQYWHNRTGEDNADAHMKRQIMGREVVVAITKGKLDLGPWEQLFYGEFDGWGLLLAKKREFTIEDERKLMNFFGTFRLNVYYHPFGTNPQNSLLKRKRRVGSAI